MTTSNPSGAMQLMTAAWKNKCAAFPHSWEKINSTMGMIINGAVSGGFKFNDGDIDYFFAGDKWNSDGMRAYYYANKEWLYVLAVVHKNMSACHALEHHFNRKPYIFTNVHLPEQFEKPDRARERLAMHFQFEWNGQKVTVTSITPEYLIACSYKARPRTGHSTAKIRRLHKITHKDLRGATK